MANRQLTPIVVTSKHLWKKRGTYIGRAANPQDAIFGNPFSHKDGTLAKFKVATVQEAIERYRDYMYDRYATDEYFRLAVNSLARMYLAGEEVILVCWCKTEQNPNAPCHGDILKEFVEQIAMLGIAEVYSAGEPDESYE